MLTFRKDFPAQQSKAAPMSREYRVEVTQDPRQRTLTLRVYISNEPQQLWAPLDPSKLWTVMRAPDLADKYIREALEWTKNSLDSWQWYIARAPHQRAHISALYSAAIADSESFSANVIAEAERAAPALWEQYERLDKRNRAAKLRRAKMQASNTSKREASVQDHYRT